MPRARRWPAAEPPAPAEPLPPPPPRARSPFPPPQMPAPRRDAISCSWIAPLFVGQSSSAIVTLAGATLIVRELVVGFDGCHVFAAQHTFRGLILLMPRKHAAARGNMLSRQFSRVDCRGDI